MRLPPVVITTTLMVMGVVIADHSFPQATRDVKAYRRLSDAEFRLMQKEAEAFAKARSGQGLVESSGGVSERYFELRADGKPVMLVDNSSMQLVVALAEDSRERAPDLTDLKQR